MGLPLFFGIIAIPYLYRHLGVEKIGILTLVWALIGYFSLFDFGLGRALTQQVSAARAAKLEKQLPSLVKSGLLFTAGTGLVGGLLLAVIAYPLGFVWLNVSQTLQHNAAQSLLIAALGIPMTTITTGLRGVLEAYEDFPHVNMLRMLLGVSNFGLPMLSVMIFGSALTWMIGGLVVARLILLIAHMLLVDSKLPKGWKKSAFSKNQLRQLFSFGAWMTVSNVIGPLMVTADRFIISAVLGASAVAYYTIPSEVLARVLILPMAVTAALFPRLASGMVSDPHAAMELHRRCLNSVAIVMTPICLSIALGSHWGLSLWLGKDFADRSWVIVTIMAAGMLLNGIAQVPFAVIQAAGHSRITAYFHIIQIIIYLPLLFVSLKFFGLIGAAGAWVIRAGLDLIMMLIQVRRMHKNVHGKKDRDSTFLR